MLFSRMEAARNALRRGRQHPEEPAHGFISGDAPRAPAQNDALACVCPPAESLKAHLQPQGPEKIALRHGAVDTHALHLRDGAGDGRKIHMGGEIALSGAEKGGDTAVAMHGLKCFARAGPVVAVIDEQKRAAVPGHVPGKAEGQGLALRRELDDAALGKIFRPGRQAWRRRTIGAKERSAGFVEDDAALAVARGRALVVMNGQGVEKFVGDDDGGQGW
jgi:hypothetical protein